jgi:hypothetical protein
MVIPQRKAVIIDHILNRPGIDGYQIIACFHPELCGYAVWRYSINA